MRVEPQDVWKIAFSTIYGTFISQVMQQGDCNAPVTLQCLMTVIFHDHLGHFVYAYLDDLFVYSETIKEHEHHLRAVFKILRENGFYLEKEKCNLYVVRLDCLGHIIDEKGVHTDRDKMSQIRSGRTPKNLNEVQRFVGLVEYLAQFMPDMSTFAMPLTGIQWNGHPFQWREIHDKCFQTIKVLVCKYPISRPINPSKPEPIWLVCDALLYGVGTLYGQGPEWKTCRPAGFMSKKLMDTQQNYQTFKRETLAIIEALMKWEDKLLGFKFTIITDHKALGYLKTQHKLSSRQVRWLDYMSRFDATIVYIKGVENKVADCLSRYYENGGGESAPDEDINWANADVHLDPEGDDLPHDRWQELHLSAMRTEGNALKKRLAEQKEAHRIEAEEMAVNTERSKGEDLSENLGDDPSLLESAGSSPNLPNHMRVKLGLEHAISAGYKDDSVLSKVLNKPEHYLMFKVRNDLIYMDKRGGEEVLCIPHTKFKGDMIVAMVIVQAHQALGHLGAQRTVDYICRWYWWPKLGREVDKYCRSCLVCQATKTDNQRPKGLLHSMPILTRP